MKYIMNHDRRCSGGNIGVYREPRIVYILKKVSYTRKFSNNFIAHIIKMHFHA